MKKYIVRLISILYLVPVLLVMLVTPVLAQNYGNAWINYNQVYFKFKVSDDGICRISYSTLKSALQQSGYQLDNISPAFFQVWGRGEQQYIFINAGTDGIFNQGDYLEFYGKKNDGWYDSTIYQHPQDILNPYYSLFNDTATYYFSWNSTPNNNRFTVEQNTNFQPYQPENYIWWKDQKVFSSFYSPGVRYPTTDPAVTLGDAAYTGGEGWTGQRIYVGLQQNIVFQLDHRYNGGPDAVFTTAVIGNSNRIPAVPNHHFNVYLGTQYIIDSIFSNNVVGLFKRNIPAALFSGTTATFICGNVEVSGQNHHEWSSVPYAILEYPHDLDMENRSNVSFSLIPGNPDQYLYLKFSNLSKSPGDTVRFYDLTRHKRIKIVEESGYFKALVPKLLSKVECYLTSDAQANVIQAVTAVNGNGFFRNLASLPVNQHADYLILAHHSMLNQAAQYASYRKNQGIPNVYQPLLVDIDEVYDQFGYGIEKHPLAIREFVRYAINEFPTRPKFLFIIGKSECPNQFRIDPVSWNHTLIPSFGYPPSDWLFSSGLESPDSVSLPVGRLSASISADVSNYLEKVQQYEFALNSPAEPQKCVLQFCGGADAIQQSLFAWYLEDYRKSMESPFFGGYVREFFKTSPDPIQVNQSDYMHHIIENQGISIINYFGHASGINFDMSIGDPADYQNEGKYYFVLANSCWAGDIFNYHNGTSSERYVLLPKKGAIAYLASVSEGEPPYLDAYTKKFYQHLSGFAYGQPLGSVCQKTFSDVVHDPGHISFSFKETCQEFILHGDPAIVLTPFQHPDYTLTSGIIAPHGVAFIPSVVTTEIDSFNLIFYPGNLGKALDTSFYVRIERSVNGNTLTDTLIHIHAPYFRDSVTVRFPVLKNMATGENKFKVTLNAFEEIDEAGSYNNNSSEVSLMIKSSEIIPVYPAKYAVIPEVPVVLKASTSNPFQTTRKYIIQIDTTDLFNSPLFREKVIEHGGGVIQWQPDYPMIQDSSVFYWRCNTFPVTDTMSWRTSSFQYIQGKKGWSQAHFYQFSENNFQFIKYLRDSLKFIYVQDHRELEASTFISGHEFQAEAFKINNFIQDLWNCAENNCYGSTGYKFAIFNPVSFIPWESQDTGGGIGPYGNRHCRNYEVPSFDFCSYDSISRSEIRNFLNLVPSGYYVLAMSHRSPRTEEFEEEIYQAFESIGSQYIRQVRDTSPYIIFGKKGGAIGTALEAGMAASRDSLITVKADVITNWNEGRIESTIIGPSKKWHSLHWKILATENDSIRLLVKGVRKNGKEETLIDGLTPDSSDIYNLWSRIDASVYPWLKLSLYVKDTSSLPIYLNPPQLKKWQVFYDGVPEMAVSPEDFFTFHKDTLAQGDSLKLKIAFRNISDENMDSVLIAYWIAGQGNHDTLVTHRLQPLPAGQILVDEFRYNTSKLSGNQYVTFEANPDYDQTEQTLVNNNGTLGFFVSTDKTNPLLDVVFDGIHIQDGDYVSPSPKINISLYDQNRFLLLNDTSLMKVWCQPSGQTNEPVYFIKNGVDQMFFSPAKEINNQCQVSWNPQFLNDGLYELTVRAVDVSGNLSGSQDYHIHFRVLHHSGITQLLCWPNPVHDFAKFSFILTGSELPDHFNIQIFTTQGELVREISSSEFGDIHIGRNLSDFSWDGTNSSGTRLANGMYFYQVHATVKGKKIESAGNLQGEVTRYFIPGTGKIILLK